MKQLTFKKCKPLTINGLYYQGFKPHRNGQSRVELIYKKPHQALHNRASTTLICRLRLKDDLPAMIKGDAEAAKRFLIRAIRRHCTPEKITIDGSAANEAVIKSYNADHGTSIEIRKVKYLNNLAL